MAKKYFIEQDKKVGSEKYSQRISKLRIEKQITLDELQEKTGIPKTTISSWIKGDFTPNIKGITAIAKALNVSVDYLVGNTDVKPLNLTLQAISKSTGLSEQAIKNLISWNNSEDRRKQWSKYISFIMESADTETLFEKISEFMGYSKVERIAANNNNGDLAIEILDLEMARLWYISKTFTDIIESMGASIRIEGEK